MAPRPLTGVATAAFIGFTLAALIGWSLAMPVASEHARAARAVVAHATAMVMPSARVPADQALARAMTDMDAAMMRVRLTGKPDGDFATMMIPHHRGAIDMARAELLYGVDPRLRRIAEEIIVTQESEIAVMQYDLAHPWTPRSVGSK